MGYIASVLLNDKNIRTQTVSQVHPLGTRGYTRDSRAFRYSQAGAAIGVGKLCQARAPSTWSDDCEISAEAIGATQCVVYIGAASTSAKSSDGTTDYFKEGILFINDGTGEGQYVPIKYQGAWSTGTTNGLYSTVHFQDEAALTIAVTTASECGFVLNPYKRVVTMPITMTSIPVGIAPRAITSSYYFWLQTWGAAAYKAERTLTVGSIAIPNNSATAGSISKLTSETWIGTGTTAGGKSSDVGDLTGLHLPRLGTIMEVGATGETGIVFLQLAS